MVYYSLKVSLKTDVYKELDKLKNQENNSASMVLRSMLDRLGEGEFDDIFELPKPNNKPKPEKRHRLGITKEQSDNMAKYMKKYGLESSNEIVKKLVEHETQVSN